MAVAVHIFLFAAVAVLSGSDICVLARSTSSPAEHNVGEPLPSYAVSMLSDEGSKLLQNSVSALVFDDALAFPATHVYKRIQLSRFHVPPLQGHVLLCFVLMTNAW